MRTNFIYIYTHTHTGIYKWTGESAFACYVLVLHNDIHVLIM